jgi:hypothetical protein
MPWFTCGHGLDCPKPQEDGFAASPCGAVAVFSSPWIWDHFVWVPATGIRVSFLAVGTHDHEGRHPDDAEALRQRAAAELVHVHLQEHEAIEEGLVSSSLGVILLRLA